MAIARCSLLAARLAALAHISLALDADLGKVASEAGEAVGDAGHALDESSRPRPAAPATARAIASRWSPWLFDRWRLAAESGRGRGSRRAGLR